MRNSNTPYDSAFYASVREGSLQSARIIVPIVKEIVNPKSVVDVGCGLGIWLAVFREYGIERILGLDGEHVDTSSLLLPKKYFCQIDLNQPFKFQNEELFDLAVSLEVAEHLPKSVANSFVKFLVQKAPVILFSAAIPLQGGTDHINEQWPEYWQQIFMQYNYIMLDPIRKLIWGNSQVKWWYRQNIFLYVHKDLISANPAFREISEFVDDIMLIEKSVLSRHLP